MANADCSSTGMDLTPMWQRPMGTALPNTAFVLSEWHYYYCFIKQRTAYVNYYNQYSLTLNGKNFESPILHSTELLMLQGSCSKK